MESVYLIKIGELVLKRGNRKDFEERLRRDLKRRLEGIENRLVIGEGRWFLHAAAEDDARVAKALASTPGIHGFARASRVDKDLASIAQAALAAAAPLRERGLTRFKVEARRSDKSFPLDSYGIAREIGGMLYEGLPGLVVDVRAPEFTVDIEIRERAYVYAGIEPGQKGLPVGSSGKGLLLLSGGIDSPVAGYLMAKRGLALDAVYFHAYPYTSKEAWEKVRDLARILSTYSGKLTLHTVPFTDAQLRIKQAAPQDCATIFMRAGMMRIAERIAQRSGARCLVTGESLGQVASQTVENLRFTESHTSLPVLRPLIGTDKEDTIALARRIGTYETSILPYEDCCVIFSPKHPLLHADMERHGAAYAALGLEPYLEAAIANTERLDIA